MKNTMRKLLAAACAASMLMTLPGVSVYAAELTSVDTIESASATLHELNKSGDLLEEDIALESSDIAAEIVEQSGGDAAFAEMSEDPAEIIDPREVDLSDSEEQDKSYFECLQECIEALGELAVNRHKQRIINKEMDVVLTTISAYSDFTDMEAATRYKREDILSRLKPYEEAAPGLEQAYDRAHSRILSMARDSVLTK